MNQASTAHLRSRRSQLLSLVSLFFLTLLLQFSPSASDKAHAQTLGCNPYIDHIEWTQATQRGFGTSAPPMEIAAFQGPTSMTSVLPSPSIALVDGRSTGVRLFIVEPNNGAGCPDANGDGKPDIGARGWHLPRAGQALQIVGTMMSSPTDVQAPWNRNIANSTVNGRFFPREPGATNRDLDYIFCTGIINYSGLELHARFPWTYSAPGLKCVHQTVTMLNRRQPDFMGVPVEVNIPEIEQVPAPSVASIAPGTVDRGLWTMWPFPDGAGAGGYRVGTGFIWSTLMLDSDLAVAGYFSEVAFRQCRLRDAQPDYYFTWLGAGVTLQPGVLGTAGIGQHQGLGKVITGSSELIYAHELGHNFGFEHSGAGTTIFQPGWDPKGTMGSFFGDPFLRVSTLLKLLNVTGATGNGARWVNPSGQFDDGGGYENVLLRDPRDAYERFRFTGNCQRAVPSLPPASQILVSGTMPVSGTGTTQLAPLFREPSGTWDTLPVSGHINSIRLLDSVGGLLYQTTFPDIDLQQDWSYFMRPVPDLPTMNRVQIVRNGVVILDRTRSTHTPTLTNVSPISGGSHYGTVTVSWSTSDGDSDPVVANVLYSPDQGASWETIGTGLASGQTSFEASAVPASNVGVIRVEVSDGLNSTYTDITGLTIGSDHAPTLKITSITNGQTFKWGENIILLASSYDLEHGRVPGSQISWMSSIDGYLGTGDLNIDSLTPGSHVITASTTVNGLTSTASVTISIDPNW